MQEQTLLSRDWNFFSYASVISNIALHEKPDLRLFVVCDEKPSVTTNGDIFKAVLIIVGKKIILSALILGNWCWAINLFRLIIPLISFI